ncbi:MAG TPA: serine/threonine-protein kinase [Ktedonobacteraceae bacterium]
MRRCADKADCGYDNRDSDLFCRACALPLLTTALAGRYVVEALVSKGGYAAVFRGIDQNLSRRIAIKVLLPSKTTPSEQEHFLREARIAATLDHPNIAPILDYGKDGPSVFLVMPLYTAGSLRTRLAIVNGPLPSTETISNFHQLVSALHYAHTRPRPVIHRDIKPENILIHQEDYRLVITDFGIARALEPGARVGKTITVRGTVGYMAPEQTSGVVDPRSDQFGCAVVLYEMLTGYHPFDGMGGPIHPPSTLNHELPSALDMVVLRALAAHPEERYADMLEFMHMFDAACRPSAGFRAYAPDGQFEVGNAPLGRGATNPSTPAVPVDGERGDSSGRQQAVRSNTSGSVREKCLEGDALLKQQHYSQALHAYEEALRMDPRNFHAWNGKGTALYSQGNYRKAYEAYQRATEIQPENPVVWVSAGLALNRLQRYSQALVHFERALAIDPQYVPAWNGKADAQLDMNMPDEAIDSYSQALAYEPNSFQAWNGLGNAQSFVRDFSGAVDSYSRALLINPRSAVAWCNKAEALVRFGHNRAALDALNEATELDRSYARAWTLKADVYEALGNYQEAQKARKRAKPWGLMN